MEITRSLELMGLKNKAAAVYIAALKLQNASPNQIAREAGLERTTVYAVLNDLARQGFVTKTFRGKRTAYLAESPLRLKQFLEKKQDILKRLLPALASLQGKKSKQPIIRFYEDKAGIRKGLSESLNCKEKLRRDFASVESMVNLLGRRFINEQIKERVKRGIRVRSLRSLPQESKVEERDWFLKKNNKDVLREVRYLDQGFLFASLVMIYDDTVTMISSKKESFALIIQSRDLTQALKILFDIAWQNSKKTN